MENIPTSYAILHRPNFYLREFLGPRKLNLFHRDPYPEKLKAPEVILASVKDGNRSWSWRA
jgi:hypothetical protein